MNLKRKQIIHLLLQSNLFDQVDSDPDLPGWSTLLKYDDGYFLTLDVHRTDDLLADLRNGNITVEKDIDLLPDYPKQRLLSFQQKMKDAYQLVAREGA